MNGTSESQEITQGELNAPAVEMKPPVVTFAEMPEEIKPKGQSVITVNLSVTDTGDNLDDKVELGHAGGAKRREVLSRRPSYRKILNDLSSTDVVQKPREIEEMKDKLTDDDLDEIKQPATFVQTGELFNTDHGNVTHRGDLQSTQTINQIVPLQNSIDNTNMTVQSGIMIPELQGMRNSNVISPGQIDLSTENAQAGSVWLPGHRVVVQTVGGGMQAFQLQDSPTQSMASMDIPRRVLQGNMQSPQMMAEDASRKREMRLLKNRDAAKECRRRKKEYVKCLETRVAVLEHQNKQLIEELKTLKELYVHKRVDSG